MTAKFPLISQTDFDKSTALRNLPIALKRIDIHAEWVSPKVLEMMGDLPEEVPGGQIERDADGKPTGVFVSGPFWSCSALSLTRNVSTSWTMPCS
jgi:predicted amidohydrolase YtcJ